MQALLADLKEPVESQEYRLKVGDAAFLLDSTPLLEGNLLVAICSTVFKTQGRLNAGLYPGLLVEQHVARQLPPAQQESAQGIWSIYEPIGWP